MDRQYLRVFLFLCAGFWVDFMYSTIIKGWANRRILVAIAEIYNYYANP